jgi:hypothetical protein
MRLTLSKDPIPPAGLWMTHPISRQPSTADGEPPQ